MQTASEALKAHSSGNIEPVLLDVTCPESIAGALAAAGDRHRGRRGRHADLGEVSAGGRRSEPSGRARALRSYSGLMAMVRKEVTKSARNALPVDAVVKAVEHAMTARKPKTRYLVGRDTWLWLLLNFLPDRWRDWVILDKIHE